MSNLVIRANAVVVVGRQRRGVSFGGVVLFPSFVIVGNVNALLEEFCAVISRRVAEAVGGESDRDVASCTSADREGEIFAALQFFDEASVDGDVVARDFECAFRDGAFDDCFDVVGVDVVSDVLGFNAADVNRECRRVLFVICAVEVVFADIDFVGGSVVGVDCEFVAGNRCGVGVVFAFGERGNIADNRRGVICSGNRGIIGIFFESRFINEDSLAVDRNVFERVGGVGLRRHGDFVGVGINAVCRLLTIFEVIGSTLQGYAVFAVSEFGFGFVAVHDDTSLARNVNIVNFTAGANLAVECAAFNGKGNI